jgi:hypothetical protein
MSVLRPHQLLIAPGHFSQCPRLTTGTHRARFSVPVTMTVQQAEAIIHQLGISVALQNRFAFDTGTMLRLDNYAIISIFDDGRYYIQGENTAALIAVFSRAEAPWDPESWSGEVPRAAAPSMFPLPNPPGRLLG